MWWGWFFSMALCIKPKAAPWEWISPQQWKCDTWLTVLLQIISTMLLWIVCPEKFLLKEFSLIFHLLCKQEPCQHLSWPVFSAPSSLFAVHPFCLRCIPVRYVIPPDFVPTNHVALMETINQFSPFWEMTYRLLLWRGRAGCDRKVLQHSKKDQEVSLQIRIMKANFIFTSWSMWSKFLFILSFSQLN